MSTAFAESDRPVKANWFVFGSLVTSIADVTLDDRVVGEDAKARFTEEVLTTELEAMDLGFLVVDRRADVEDVQRIAAVGRMSYFVANATCCAFVPL